MFELKGQSNEISIHFFHYSNLLGPKYFRFWLRFHWVIRILVLKKLTRRGMIPWGDWLVRLSYPGEIESSGNHTGTAVPRGRHILADFLLTRRGIIPRGDWLAGVSYPREIDSPGYHTPRRLTRQGIIPWRVKKLKIRITRRIINKNRKYFNTLVSGPGRF